MDFKPSDFFIGVIDFFAVILPGALVTFFLKGLLYLRVFGEGKVFPSPEGEVQGWIIFLLITYVIGNLLFLIGSILLDKLVYDKLLRKPLLEKNFDLSYQTATAIRDQYWSSDIWISELIAEKRLDEKAIKAIFAAKKREVINTFKWGQHYLALEHPEALVEIKKFEADSKFFRSLVVAFLIISAVLLSQRHWLSAASFFALSLFSLYRYGDLRYKSTEAIYEIIITLNHLTKILLEPAVVTRDTRIRFVAAPEVVAPYQQRIAALTTGLQVSTELLAIPLNETWEVLNSSVHETLFCLRGRCILRGQRDTGPEQTTILSSNAILPMPVNSSFRLLNNQPDPLLLLAVR